MAEEAHRPDDERVEGEQVEKQSSAARLFDVRRVIGALFVVYGVIVTLVGIFDGQAEIDKAQGVRINLWMGISMLVLGGLFLLWLWWRPIEVVPTPDRDDETGPEARGEN